MRVLQSFPAGRTTTNPYLVQLAEQLAPEPEVLGFTWRRALTEPYDVFHVHWPEVLLHGTTAGRSRVKRFLFRALLLRLWWRRHRTAVVRTVHNVRSHEGGGRGERELLARLERRTTLWIRLNPTTEVPSGAPVRTIAHGDYRDWFGAQPAGPHVPGRIVYFGLIRPYKGVPDLIDTFTTLPVGPDGDALALRVVGRPTTADIGAEVTLAALSDDRVTVSLGHATDAELAKEVTQAELVALPYREMHNSGAAVLALSLGRPILVPSNPVTEALRVEVGGNWVFTYRGTLTAAHLRDALARCRAARPLGYDVVPDLSERAWPVIAALHRDAYAAATALLGAGPRPSGRRAEQPVVGGEATVDPRQIVENSGSRSVLP
jgi:beta-1,4-mannosyltransferase